MSLKITYDKNMIITNSKNYIISFYVEHTDEHDIKQEYYCKWNIYKDEILNKFYGFRLSSLIYIDDEEKEEMLNKWSTDLCVALRLKNYCYFFDSLCVDCFFHVDNSTTVYDVQSEDFVLKIKYKTKHEVLLENHYRREPKFLSFWKIQYDDDDDEEYEEDEDELDTDTTADNENDNDTTVNENDNDDDTEDYETEDDRFSGAEGDRFSGDDETEED